MNQIEWDDLKLFFHVATEGGLAGAASRTGLSAPTIGWRMLALERSMGRALFIRSQQGYRLAPDGKILIERVRAMHATADLITEWHQRAFSHPIISVGSDAWLSGFLAEHSKEIRKPGEPLRLCCKTTSGEPAFAYREIDVAVVSRRPQTGNLAVQRCGQTAYATYCAIGLDQRENLPWVSMGTESAISAADQWVFKHHEAEIMTWTSAQPVLLKLIRASNGRGVLPCFVGDADPALQRLGPVIDELTHPLWIVVNADDRHRPEMRLVIGRLLALLKRFDGQFSGAAHNIAALPAHHTPQHLAPEPH